MELSSFFAAGDAARAERTLQKLAHHDISGWALAGGIAIEVQLMRRGRAPALRALHDIDFISGCFGDIPQSLAGDFHLRHVHPDDPPGKTLLQAVDAPSRLRVDVFRAYGDEMERTTKLSLAGLTLRIVSIEDLVARHARLNWDLMEGKPVAPKFARDFLRMLEVVNVGEVEAIWQEHRKPHFPASFAEVVTQLRTAIASRPELLVAPVYSTDVLAACPRCRPAVGFPLADAGLVLSLLGYC
jgi:hypothetical protein